MEGMLRWNATVSRYCEVVSSTPDKGLSSWTSSYIYTLKEHVNNCSLIESLDERSEERDVTY